MGDPPRELADGLHALRPAHLGFAFGPRPLRCDLAGDVEESDHDVGDRVAVEDGASIGAHGHPAAVASMDHEIVHHHRLARGEGADERHLLLRIEVPVAIVDPIGLGVLATGDIVASAHAHDLGKGGVGVDEFAAGGTRDPDAHGERVGDGRHDLFVGYGHGASSLAQPDRKR